MKKLYLALLFIFLSTVAYSASNKRFSIELREDLPTVGMQKAMIYVIKDDHTQKKYLFVSDGSTGAGGLTLLSD